MEGLHIAWDLYIGDTCFQAYPALKLSIQPNHFLFINLCVDMSNYSLRYLSLS